MNTLAKTLPVTIWRGWVWICLIGISLYLLVPTLINMAVMPFLITPADVEQTVSSGMTMPTSASGVATAESADMTTMISTDQQKKMAPFNGVVFLILTFLSIGTLWIFNRKVTKGDFGLDRLNWERMAITLILSLVILVIAQKYIGPFFEEMINGPKPAGSEGVSDNIMKMLGFGDTLWVNFLVMFAIAVAGPMAEEFVFRGLIFRSVRDGLANKKILGASYIPVVIAVLVSVFFFVVAHTAPGQVGQYPVMIILSSIFALSYWWSGSLYVPIVLHTINNAWGQWAVLRDAGTTDPQMYEFLLATPFISIAIVYVISLMLKKD